MGKRILTQRRGKGGIQYRAAEKGKVADARYPSITSGDTVNGVIEDFVHDRGRSSPLTKIRLNSGQISYIPAVSGLQSGSMIEIGPSAEIKNGNVLPLKHIPEGQAICNIELIYGDGGKLVRASGGSAILFAAMQPFLYCGQWVFTHLGCKKLAEIGSQPRAAAAVTPLE